MMLSKRKLRLRETEKNDEEVEEVILDDDDIDQIFEVHETRPSANHRRNQLKFYPTNNKRNDDKQKENNKQAKNKLPSKQADDDDDDDGDQSDSSYERRIKTSSQRISLNKSTKSSSAVRDDDELVCLDSGDEDSMIVDDEDEIIICSNHNSPVRSTRSPVKSSRSPVKSSRSPVKSSRSADTSLDQFDPSLLPANFKFVKTTRIKFKFKGTYHCVVFKSTDKFKDKLDELSQTLSIGPSSMILMFDNKTIPFEETPESLNIGICDIIDVFEKKDEELDDPNLMKLKFRDCESRKKVQDVVLTMNRYDTFEKIFHKYAQLKDTPLERIVFEFDGEKMSAGEKPDDLDMESDSLIDVKIKGA